MKALKLGEMVSDIVSGTTGMLTHLLILMDGAKQYVYQPRGLNPKTGSPVDAIWLQETRIKGGIPMDIDVPMQLMNTPGTDKASGFKGTITGFVYHMDNCLHVEIKPKGVLKDTGNTIDAKEFDIRRVTGREVDKFMKSKAAVPVKKQTSPTPLPARRK